MTENEMIKDMAETMDKLCCERFALSEGLCYSGMTTCGQCQAKDLYEAGWSKVAEDEMVIKKSDYEQLNEYYERWKETDRQLYTARQDAANEIVEELLPYQGHYPVYVLVNRLCKKFGLFMEELE